jgi:hypothetical protein
MTHYEYIVKSKSSNQSLHDFLNGMANEGWQLKLYLPGEGFVFERGRTPPPPKSSPPESGRKTSKAKRATP